MSDSPEDLPDPSGLDATEEVTPEAVCLDFTVEEPQETACAESVDSPDAPRRPEMISMVASLKNDLESLQGSIEKLGGDFTKQGADAALVTAGAYSLLLSLRSILGSGSSRHGDTRLQMEQDKLRQILHREKVLQHNRGPSSDRLPAMPANLAQAKKVLEWYHAKGKRKRR